MTKWISIILLAVVLLSCAGEPKHYAPAVKNAKPYRGGNPGISVPAWILSPPPSQNQVIGIAYRGEDSIDSARNQASVILSRNLSSYTVKKHARIKTDTDRSSDEEYAQFEVNVSSTPNARNIYDRLVLLHDNDLDGYTICIFAPDDCPIDTTLVEYEPDTEPDWIDRHIVVEEGDYVSAIATCSSSDLINAYETALVDARYSLAQYKSQAIQAMRKINENDSGGKIITSSEFETLVELENLSVSRMHIRRKYCSGLYSYVVYIEMRMRA